MTNNTATTITSLTIPDGTHAWNVNCSAGTLTNTSVSHNLVVDFNTYTSGDVAEVGVDLIVGLLAVLFSFITLIGLAVVYALVKGKKVKPPF